MAVSELTMALNSGGIEKENKASRNNDAESGISDE